MTRHWDTWSTNVHIFLIFLYRLVILEDHFWEKFPQDHPSGVHVLYAANLGIHIKKKNNRLIGCTGRCLRPRQPRKQRLQGKTHKRTESGEKHGFCEGKDEHHLKYGKEKPRWNRWSAVQWMEKRKPDKASNPTNCRTIGKLTGPLCHYDWAPVGWCQLWSTGLVQQFPW